MFFLLPIGHDTRVKRFPWVTVTIMGVCVAVQLLRFLLFWPPRAEFDPNDPIVQFGYRATEAVSLNVVLSTFVHGGWFHLAANLLFLWLVGFNLEDRWGRLIFAGFYLVGGAAGSLAFVLWHLGSSIPLVGASGAIAAVMGAFLVCLHRTQIRFWYCFFICLALKHGTFFAPAYVAFPIWFGVQLLSSLAESASGAGTAYSAHVGGFAFGVATAVILKLTGVEQKLLAQRDREVSGWQEDPDYVAALTLLGQGQLQEAFARLQRTLERNPAHADARAELATVALELGNHEVAAQVASQSIEHLARSDQPRALGLYRSVNRTAPAAPLTDRALAQAARCAMTAGDASVALQATRRLMGEHPSSPLVPRAMWDAARLQRELGRPDLSERTLHDLIAAFPVDPFAEQAKQHLGET